MEIIKHDEKVNVIIYRDEDWVEGLNFITPESMFIQVGSGGIKKEKCWISTSTMSLIELE